MHFTYSSQRTRRFNPYRLPIYLTLIALSIATGAMVAPATFAAPAANVATGAMVAPAIVAAPAANVANATDASTNHSISGPFLNLYDVRGGVGIFGYPISDVINENGLTVQYFERQRIEYHPEAAGTPNEIQLGRLGAELASAARMRAYPQPFKSRGNQVYFRESKHSLKSPFIEYWRANGDIRVFGYPMTEPFTENGMLVQYFERARMEYNPRLGSGSSAIQLGLLGRQYLKKHPGLNRDVRSLDITSRGSQPAQQQRIDLTASPSDKEAQLLDLINRARQEQGLGTVTFDGTLRSIALSRSKDMAERSYFSHTTPEGTTFLNMLKNANVPYSYAGEIIANNNYQDSETTMQAYEGFMNSPDHHEIIMDPHYTLAGVGEATDDKGFHYFTVIFINR